MSGESEILMDDRAYPDAAEHAARLARLYLVLSRVNRAIENAPDERALLQSACEIVVEVGQFHMSWAGLVEPVAGVVQPVARAGHDEGYADLVRIELHGERSQGPTGQALLAGREVVCDDIATDPRMGPWREEALARGYRSSVGLPLLSAGQVIGVLTAYAAEPHRFGAGEMELLQELGRDVSHGLAVLNDVAERHRAESALEASEERFRTSIDTLIDPFVIMRAIRDDSGRIVDFEYEYANQAASVANRMRREDLVGSRLLSLLPEHGPSGLFEAYARVVETGEPLIIDDLEYEDSWAGERLAIVFDVRASKLGDGLAYTWRDVTERRNAERRRSEELERRVHERTVALETARERAFEVAELTTATLQAATASEVAHVLLEALVRTSGAADGAVVVMAQGRRETLDSFGFLPDSLRRLESVALDQLTPVSDAIRAGTPVVLTDPDAFRIRYPALDSLADEITSRVRVVVPLRAGDISLGAVNIGFDRPRTIDDEELAFLVSLANNAAHALERLRLAESERETRGLLEAVVSQMPVGVSLVAANGTPMYRNAALDALLGQPTSAHSVEAYPEIEGFHPDGRRYAADEWPESRSLSTGETVVNEEITIRRADGRSVTVMQTSASVRDAHGYPIAAVVVTLDITARKEADELRDAFMGVLSHELRTPVTTIFGGAKLLASRGDRLDAETRQELIGDIAYEGEHLTRLVDDLLVLARAERGVDLTSRSAALVQHRLRSVVRSLAVEWPERRFVQEIPDHVPPVTGDEAYLEQVFRNLVGNAAKYGRSRVIARVEPGEGVVRVSILDDGPGIDPAEIDRIFEIFFRASSTGNLPGAGIGLFVARRLVEAMGGTLTAANRPEGGAQFTVTLPEFAESGAR